MNIFALNKPAFETIRIDYCPWMEMQRQKILHPIILCGPVCVLLPGEPSACMCVCLNLSMYEYPFSCHVPNM